MTFVATPSERLVKLKDGKRIKLVSWTWEPARTQLLIEIALAGGRLPGADEVLRAALGLS